MCSARYAARAARSLRRAWLAVAPAPDARAVCAPQFVELHGEPLLEQLYESFRRHYPEVVFREPPRRGTLVLDEVRRSTYFFS